jgi:hypothetical protein
MGNEGGDGHFDAGFQKLPGPPQAMQSISSRSFGVSNDTRQFEFHNRKMSMTCVRVPTGVNRDSQEPLTERV